jgi:hypothetical protein
MQRFMQRRPYGVVFPAIAALVSLALAPATADAQAAEASALRVLSGGTQTYVARAVLDASEMVETSTGAIGVSGVTSGLATALTTGGSYGTASVATLSNLRLLNGLITATGVTAIASRYPGGHDAGGSGFEGLVVAGIPVGTGGSVAPNTRMSLPGVGYVILNEQVVRDGVLQVTMLRVVQQSLLGTKLGEIAVASVSTGR